MADPIHQFQVTPIDGLNFGEVTLPIIGTTQIAFTNSHLAMTIAFAMVVGFLALVTSGAKIVPGRLQAAGETLFDMIDGVTDSIIGHEGRKYFPFVFTLFTLILAMNLLGMFLTFTATSQLAVTLTLALITILLVIGVGIFAVSTAVAAFAPQRRVVIAALLVVLAYTLWNMTRAAHTLLASGGWSPATSG